MHTTIDISDAAKMRAITDICHRHGFSEEDFARRAIDFYIEYNMAPGRSAFGLFRDNPIDVEELRKSLWAGEDGETSRF